MQALQLRAGSSSATPYPQHMPMVYPPLPHGFMQQTLSNIGRTISSPLSPMNGGFKRQVRITGLENEQMRACNLILFGDWLLVNRKQMDGKVICKMWSTLTMELVMSHLILKQQLQVKKLKPFYLFHLESKICLLKLVCFCYSISSSCKHEGWALRFLPVR